MNAAPCLSWMEWRRVFFGKYPSLPGALLVKCLQSSHLYHLTILNGGEVTTLLALSAANNGNALLETPVTSMIYDRLTNNPLKMGIIEPFRGIVKPLRGIIKPFRGIIQPLTFWGIIQPNLRRIFRPNRSSGRNDLHDSAHWEEPECLFVNKECKQRILVQKIVGNTFTKAMPGYHEPQAAQAPAVRWSSCAITVMAEL